MNPEGMERRRQAGLQSLQEAIDELGPITDETAASIREPLLEVIDTIESAGQELKNLDFHVYDEREES